MSDLPNQVAVRRVISDWLDKNVDRSMFSQKKFEITESPAKGLSAWFETTEFLVDIAAWEHACCLDVIVFEQSSGDVVFSEDGACESEEGLVSRLERLFKWLSEHRGPASNKQHQ